MGDKSPIEWTDATWNPITGCSIEDLSCTGCYAMKMAGTRLSKHPSRAGLTQMTKAGPVWTGEVRFNPAWLNQPLRWRMPRQIFVVAHGDLFHPNVQIEWIHDTFGVMGAAQHHFYQVLTKRPDRMRGYLRNALALARDERNGISPVRDRLRAWLTAGCPNVIFGTSVARHDLAELRRPPMAAISGMGFLTWVSFEPALGPVDWRGWEFLDGMVAGGESDQVGAPARPHSVEWHRAARDFCVAYGIAFDFKQWGGWVDADQLLANLRAAGELSLDGDPWAPPSPLPYGAAERLARLVGKPIEHHSDGSSSIHIGKKAAGRLLDGIIHDGFTRATRPTAEARAAA